MPLMNLNRAAVTALANQAMQAHVDRRPPQPLRDLTTRIFMAVPRSMWMNHATGEAGVLHVSKPSQIVGMTFAAEPYEQRLGVAREAPSVVTITEVPKGRVDFGGGRMLDGVYAVIAGPSAERVFVLD